MINNDEIQANVNYCRYEVSKLRHRLNNIKKGSKELGDRHKELGIKFDNL